MSTVTLNIGPKTYTVACADGEEAHIEGLGAMIAEGDVTPIVDRVCTLEEVPDALRRLHAGDARGKIVVAPHHP